MSAIRAEGVCQRYGARLALHPIDLDLAPGERVAVLGGNGAGKTTLLRILATASRPAAGRLEILDLDALAGRDAARKRIGHVGHRLGLYERLTGAENLRFFAALRGLPAAAVGPVLERVDLAGAAARPVFELSRGMRQRLALARSLLHDPPVWILDEPDASLDAAGREMLGSLMSGRTVVLATHDHELAARLCRRSMVLEEGRVVAAPAGLRLPVTASRAV